MYSASTKTTIKKAFPYIILVIAVWSGIKVLSPVITVIVLSFLTAYMTYGLYEWFKRKTGGGIAMMLTWVVIVATIVVPLIILLQIVASQSSLLVNDLTQSINTDNFSISSILGRANTMLAKIPYIEYQINLETLQGWGLDLAQRLSQTSTKLLSDLGSSAISLLTNVILYIFTVSGLLVGYRQFSSYLKSILPMDQKTFDLYLSNLGGMGSSMIKATIVIAFLQTIVTALSLWIVGVPYVGLWSAMVFLFSIIPMIGSSFLVMPLAVIMLLMGNIRGGLILIIINQLITNNIDNVLRPKLVEKNIKINETISLLSIFGGISLFGLMGVIYGPMIMSFVIVTFDIYGKHKITSSK